MQRLFDVISNGDDHKAAKAIIDEHNVDVKKSDYWKGWSWTPLMYAIERGRERIVELLIREGADIDCLQSNGWKSDGDRRWIRRNIPLQFAVKRNKVGAVRALLAAGVSNLSIESNNGEIRGMLANAKREREEKERRQELENERARMLEVLGPRHREMEALWTRQLERVRHSLEQKHDREMEAVQHKMQALEHNMHVVEHKMQVLKQSHERKVQQVVKHAQRYDTSSAVVGERVVEATNVCQAMVLALDSESNQSDVADGAVASQIRHYRALQLALSRTKEYIRQVEAMSIQSKGSPGRECKALSAARAALYQYCATLLANPSEDGGERKDDPKVSELISARAQALSRAQEAIAKREQTVALVHKTVKGGVALLGDLQETLSVSMAGGSSAQNEAKNGSSQVPCETEGKAEASSASQSPLADTGAALDTPDFSEAASRIERAYNSYTKALSDMQSRDAGAPVKGLSAIVDSVRGMQQLRSVYREAVDDLMTACDAAIAQGNEFCEDLERRSQVMSAQVQRRCDDLRQALIRLSKASGAAKHELVVLKAPVNRTAALLQEKSQLISEKAQSEFRRKNDTVLDLQEDLLSLAHRIEVRQKKQRDVSALVEKRAVLLREYEKWRADKAFQAFRRGVRYLMCDLPELRLQFPLLTATAEYDVATVDYSMFRVAEGDRIHDGNNTVVRATVVGDHSMDTLAVPQGSDVVLKELLHDEDESVLKCVVAGMSQLRHDSLVALLGVTERYDLQKCVMYRSLVFPLYKGDMRTWLQTQRSSKWLAKRAPGSESKRSESQEESNSKLSEAERREQRVVHTLRPALEALAYLHASGVLHCDLKPENILLDEEGRGVLCDLDGFRIAAVSGGRQGGGSEAKEDYRVTKQLTLPVTSPKRQEFGTDGYRDPNLKEFSTSSDVYAVGIILAECLLGWDPVKHGDSYDAHQALRQAVSRGTGIAKDMDESSRQLLSAMLRKDESKRPSVRDVLEHPCFKGRPVVRMCMGCLDEEVPVSRGVQCAGRHFMCDSCLNMHIETFAEKLGTVGVEDSDGTVPCAEAKCGCTFADYEIFECLADKTVWRALLEARNQRLEADVRMDVGMELKSEYEQRFERWKRQSALERVQEERKHAEEQVAALEGIRVGLVQQTGGTRGGFGQRLKRCPNGHYYTVGACGGAMQLGTCADCGAVIGGGRHRNAAGCQDLDFDSELRRWQNKVNECQAKEREIRSADSSQ